MAELPLSKFAPFEKYEAGFKPEVTEKLKEINIRCKGCIYFGDKKEVSMIDPYGIHDFVPSTPLYDCTIFTDRDCAVAENSLCKFFTPIEDVTETSPNSEENEGAESEEELSIQIQKLDFTNSNVTESIKNLRDKLINEQP